MSSYFIYHINYIISFYNTPNILKFYFFLILFKYFILFFFYYFSFSIPFPLFLPQPLALVSTHRAPHTHRPMIHRSTQVITLLKQTFFILEKPRQKRLRIKIHKFHFLFILPQLSRKPNSSQREL